MKNDSITINWEVPNGAVPLVELYALLEKLKEQYARMEGIKYFIVFNAMQCFQMGMKLQGFDVKQKKRIIRYLAALHDNPDQEPEEKLWKPDV